MVRYLLIHWDTERDGFMGSVPVNCGSSAESVEICTSLEQAEERAREILADSYPDFFVTIGEIKATYHEEAWKETVKASLGEWGDKISLYAPLGREDDERFYDYSLDITPKEVLNHMETWIRAKNPEFGELFFHIVRPILGYHNPSTVRIVVDQ